MTPMKPTEEKSAAAYRENADRAAETNAQWADVSQEANEYLGDA